MCRLCVFLLNPSKLFLTHIYLVNEHYIYSTLIVNWALTAEGDKKDIYLSKRHRLVSLPHPVSLHVTYVME